MDLPHQDMLVLLAMADDADHNGQNIFPGLRLVAWKTGYSLRQVRRIVRDLEVREILKPITTTHGRAVVYSLQPSKAKKKAPYRHGEDMVSGAHLCREDMVSGGGGHLRHKGEDIMSGGADIAMSAITVINQNQDPDPPKAPQGARTQKRQIVSEEALGVLRYLNAANQRHYENASQIQTLLNTGVSVHDCRLVIDFGCAVLQAERPQWYVQYFDNVTPFRPTNFDKYRARARTWDATARHPATPKRERLPL